MAYINCQCGNRLSNSGNPEIEIFAYPSKQWENDVWSLKTIDPIEIPDPELLIWKCPNCGRLYVFPIDHTGHYSDRPIIYKVEKDLTKDNNEDNLTGEN